MMGVFCRRCRKPMRSRSRTVHVRCQLHPDLADDILVHLRLRLGADMKRLARDFGVDYDVMLAAMKMAQWRRRERIYTASARATG